MQTSLAHLQLNVAVSNLPFYKGLFGFLGWETIYEADGMLGTGAGKPTSLWFGGEPKAVTNDYDGPGVNHIGIGAESQADVDAAAAYLATHGVACLFETPRHRPEFAESPEHTYYQVMFESPDRILFEVVYTGPKQTVDGRR